MMRKKNWMLIGLPLAMAGGLMFQLNQPEAVESEEKDSTAAVETTTPEGRAEWEFERQKDPATGKIPENIHMRELAYASTLPKARSGSRSSSNVDYQRVGPFNVGGRTRAIAYDLANPDVILAGGVSGGMWRSANAGQTWSRVTAPEDHSAVSCVAQDPRSGNTNVWYYGSGEVSGNSASKSFSAPYRGGGMYKSTDGGITWNQIASTTTDITSSSTWDAIFGIAVDPTRTDSSIVYAAIEQGIMRSNDGGDTWSLVLGGSPEASFLDLKMSTTGVLYAAISTDGFGPAGGFWRSEDGFNWTEITPPSLVGFDRTLVAIAPSNENQVLFFSVTPGAGNDDHSLWQYNYLSGNGSGSGGNWTELSQNLPGFNTFNGMNTFNGYCMALAIKPDNPNVVFIGGTNLFRSTSGFTTPSATTQIGGYSVFGDPSFNTRQGRQHPDQHGISFHPNDPNRMLSTSDGGVHYTANCVLNAIEWESLNNGYYTTQFYALAMDRGTPGSEVIVGGLQDNGSYWTNTSSSTADWATVRGSDGAYVAIEDGGGAYYLSTQYANIERTKINSNGNVTFDINVMPPSRPGGQGSGFNFVHPFTLDPANTNIMYLPYENELWRNNNLSAADVGQLNWAQIATFPTNFDVTCIGASKDEQGVVYVGSDNRTIYRVEDAHISNSPTITDVTSNITSGAFTSCLEVDPRDPDKVIAVYSNYNVQSLWYTENGGQDWSLIEGNLKGTPAPNVPPNLYYISDGPSVRWAKIMPVGDETVYMVGTSVGLFATNVLNGDDTEWVQQGADLIGNVVVDMMDFRESDGVVVIGTHGNGIYRGTINEAHDVTSADQSIYENSLNLTAFPNPATDEISVRFEVAGNTNLKLYLYDAAGRRLQTVAKGIFSEGEHVFPISLAGLSAGMYYYSLQGDGVNITRPLVKR